MTVKIGRYEPLSLLRRGRKRLLLRCRDPRDGATVVIKLVRPRWKAHARTQRQMLRELDVARAASHPGLLPVLAAGRHQGAGYVVLPEQPNGSLAERMHGQPRWAYAHAFALAEHLLLALDSLHRAGWVHLDVKPANVLLDASQRPILTDFGLARPLRDLVRRRYLGGTPGYMSPEQACLIEGPVDGRSDLFSLGVLLFQLLTRASPFPSSRRQEYFAALLAPPTWPSVAAREVFSPALFRFFESALAREPEARFPDASAMLQALRAASR